LAARAGDGPVRDAGHAGEAFLAQSAGWPVGVRESRGNFPTRVSRFIGRETELAEVRDLLAASRLVTLTGMGGAGKTRLGLQVAAGLAGDGDGVWFADGDGR
jgi:hypothetical protein